MYKPLGWLKILVGKKTYEKNNIPGNLNSATPHPANETSAKPVPPVIPGINPDTSLATDSAYSVHKTCILVVEKHNDLLRCLADELATDFNVFVADNGITAINRLETIPIPEIIISNTRMDNLDGFGLLRKIAADKRLAHIPFIFLSDSNTPEDKITGLGLGAFDVISKPFSIKELKMKIRSIVMLRKRTTEWVIRQSVKQVPGNHHTRTQTNRKTDEIFYHNALQYHLSPREKEVAAHIRHGLKYEDIGKKLHISENTVTRHVQNLYKKTGAVSKISLIDKLFSV